MAEPTDHMKAFTDAVTEQLHATAPPPGGIPTISLPPGHPLAQLLQAMAGGVTSPLPPGVGIGMDPSQVPEGATVVIDFDTAPPLLAKALRRHARTGLTAGDMSPNKAAGLRRLADSLEALPRTWLSGTLVQAVVIYLAGDEEMRCYDRATAPWFIHHAPIFASVMDHVRTAAAEEDRAAGLRTWLRRTLARLSRKA